MPSAGFEISLAEQRTRFLLDAKLSPSNHTPSHQDKVLRRPVETTFNDERLGPPERLLMAGLNHQVDGKLELRIAARSIPSNQSH